MPHWLRNLFVWTALLSFAVGAKLHLPLVQAAGWTRMTVNYARLMPLRDAFETAVSGKELCAVCEYVRNAEHAKAATDAVLAKSAATPDLPVMLPDLAPPRFDKPVLAPWENPADRFGESRRGVPETPPPRAAV